MLAAAGAAALCGLGCAEKKAEPPTRPVPVVVTPAQTVVAPEYLEEIGYCVALEQVTLIPQVGGQIVEIHFADGQEVKAGDSMFTIDPRPYQAALDQAAGKLAQDQATLALNRAKLDRSKGLVPGDFVSPQDFESLQTDVSTYEAMVAQDSAAVETARINLEYCSIRTPIQGKAGLRQVDLGNVVTANSSKLVTIQRMDPLFVDFTVTESELQSVLEAYRKSGDTRVEATYTAADGGKVRRSGELYFIDNQVDMSTGTVRLRCAIGNQDRLYWPGQFVQIRLILAMNPDAILVPNGCIELSQSGPYVFVVGNDNKAKQQTVKTGQRQGEFIVVKEGLKSGDRVVLTGQLLLQDGKEVTIKSESAPKLPDLAPAPLGPTDAPFSPALINRGDWIPGTPGTRAGMPEDRSPDLNGGDRLQPDSIRLPPTQYRPPDEPPPVVP